MRPTVTYFCSKVSLVIASVHKDGMHVEVYAGGRDAELLPNGYQPVVATFRSEVEGEIRVAFDVVGATVEIPL